MEPNEINTNPSTEAQKPEPKKPSFFENAKAKAAERKANKPEPKHPVLRKILIRTAEGAAVVGATAAAFVLGAKHGENKASAGMDGAIDVDYTEIPME